MIRQAVFLVGGRGTRLGSLSADTPKPLQPIAHGLRFIDLLLDQAARHGFNDIVLLAGHLGEQVEAAYHGRAVREARVRVVREPAPMGTGGALTCAASLLEPTFLMANGDSYFDFNLRALTQHPLSRSLGRLALRQIEDAARYGTVRLDGGRVTAFVEKDPAQVGPALINGGVYLLARDILATISGPCSLEADIFPRAASSGVLEGVEFDGYFLDIGLPETLRIAREAGPLLFQRPLAVLDRDGVLNLDAGYTHRIEDLVWIPGAREAVRLLNDRGYYVVVASNQAGVARGLYDEAAVGAFHAHMQVELAAVGAHIDAFYYCPFHADAVLDQYRAADHPDRKPNPGMLLRALEQWPADRARSFVVGDKPSDMEAATRAGLKGWLFEGGDLAAFVERIVAR